MLWYKTKQLETCYAKTNQKNVVNIRSICLSIQWVVRILFYFPFCCCDDHQEQKPSREEMVYFFFLQVMRESQGRNPEAGTKAEAKEECCLLTSPSKV